MLLNNVSYNNLVSQPKINQNASQSPNFKQINRFKIPKTLYFEPNNSFNSGARTIDYFERFMNGTKGKLSTLFYLLTNKTWKRAIPYFETPAFIGTKMQLQKEGDYSLKWLTQNTGISEKVLLPKEDSTLDPEDRDFYWMYLVTGKDKKNLMKKYSLKSYLSLINMMKNEAKEKIKQGESYLKSYAIARSAELSNSPFFEYLKDKEIKDFDLTNLPEVLRVKDELLELSEKNTNNLNEKEKQEIETKISDLREQARFASAINFISRILPKLGLSESDIEKILIKNELV